MVQGERQILAPIKHRESPGEDTASTALEHTSGEIQPRYLLAQPERLTSSRECGKCGCTPSQSVLPAGTTTSPTVAPRPAPLCTPLQTLAATAEWQTFSDGSVETGVYSPYSNCSWLILPTIPGGAVELRLDRLDLEPSYDFLIVKAFEGLEAAEAANLTAEVLMHTHTQQVIRSRLPLPRLLSARTPSAPPLER